MVDARKRRGWTQVQLAQRASVSTTALSKLERGNVHSEIGTVLRVVAALGLQLRLADKAEDLESDLLDDLLGGLGPNR